MAHKSKKEAALDPPFTIQGFEEIGPKPDGTPRRNKWAVHVEIGGCVYRVFIRRFHYQVHIPLLLRGYPRVAKMKHAVADLMRPHIEAVKAAEKLEADPSSVVKMTNEHPAHATGVTE